jgi:hypothetical protein
MLSIIDILFKGFVESQDEVDFILVFLKEQEQKMKLDDSNILNHILDSDELDDLFKQSRFKKEIITTLSNILKEGCQK